MKLGKAVGKDLEETRGVNKIEIHSIHVLALQ